MPRVAVIVRVPVAAGRRDDVLAAYARYVEENTKDGNSPEDVFAVNADLEHPDAVWLYEVYTDEDAYEAHFHTQARRRLHERLDGLHGGPMELVRLELVSLSWTQHLWTNDSASVGTVNAVTEEVT
jgi:quinol monooxygenase YgiN